MRMPAACVMIVITIREMMVKHPPVAEVSSWSVLIFLKKSTDLSMLWRLISQLLSKMLWTSLANYKQMNFNSYFTKTIKRESLFSICSQK